MRTEGGLSQESRHELVTVDLVDATSHGTPPPVEPLPLFELPNFGAAMF